MTVTSQLPLKHTYGDWRPLFRQLRHHTCSLSVDLTFGLQPAVQKAVSHSAEDRNSHQSVPASLPQARFNPRPEFLSSLQDYSMRRQGMPGLQRDWSQPRRLRP